MNDFELLAAVEKDINQAYTEHMRVGTSRPTEPIDPLELLATVSGTGSLDPHVHGPVIRDSYATWREEQETELGVNIARITGASFLVNLLTEDNLPHYTAANMKLSSRSEPLTEWVREWTAEEDAHGLVMREYALHAGLIATGGVIEPSAYQAGRVQQLRTGTAINPPSIHHAFSYLTLQEQLTLEAHRNLSWLLDPMGRQIMMPIFGDEQKHYRFYQKASRAALDADLDTSLVAMAHVYDGFEMPGEAGIPDFGNLAYIIGVSGIFDLETIAQSEQTIAKKLGVEEAQPTTDDGKRAQAKIMELTSDERIAKERHVMEGLRDHTLANQDPAEPKPLIIGRTVDWKLKKPSSTQEGATNLTRREGLVSLVA